MNCIKTTVMAGLALVGCCVANAEGVGEGRVAHYFRVTFTQLQPDYVAVSGKGVLQLAEIALYDAEGNRINTGLSEAAVGTVATDLEPGQFVCGRSYAYGSPTETFACAFDGDSSTKFCLGIDVSSGGKFASPVVLTMRLADTAPAAVGYNYETAAALVKAEASRRPVGWRIEFSFDGETWHLVEDREFVSHPEEIVAEWYNSGSPFELRIPADENQVVATVSGWTGRCDNKPHSCSLHLLYAPANVTLETNWTWTTDTEFAHNEPESCVEPGSYTNSVRISGEGVTPWIGSAVVQINSPIYTPTFYRVTFTQLQKDHYGTAFQLSELALYDAEGNRINLGLRAMDSWKDPTEIQEGEFSAGGNYHVNAGDRESMEKLFDGDETTKFCPSEAVLRPDGMLDTPYSVTFRLADSTPAAVAYNFRTAMKETAANCDRRRPVGWTIEFSFDGVTWYLAEERVDQPYPTVNDSVWYNDGENMRLPVPANNRSIGVALSDWTGAYSGLPHTCPFRLVYVPEGAAVESKWTWSTGDEYAHDGPEPCTAVGTYDNAVRVSCEGLPPWTGTAKVTVTNASTSVIYYRLTFLAVEPTDETSMQLSELALYDAAGNRVNVGLSERTAGIAASALGPGEFTCGGTYSYGALTETAVNLFDDDATTKVCFRYVKSKSERSMMSEPRIIVMRLPDGAAKVASYNFRTAGAEVQDIYSQRRPVTWKFEWSFDGENWVLADEQVNAYNPTENDSVWYNHGHPFKVDIPSSPHEILAHVIGWKGPADGTTHACRLQVRYAPADAPLEEKWTWSTGTAFSHDCAESCTKAGVYFNAVRLTVPGVSTWTGSAKVDLHPPKKPKFYRLSFTRMQKECQLAVGNSAIMQLSEFLLADAFGNRINQGFTEAPFGTPVTSLQPGQFVCSGEYNYGSGETWDKLFDGDANTKVCINRNLTFEADVYDQTLLLRQPCVVTMRVSAEANAATCYNFRTASKEDQDVYANRRPIGWKLEASADGESWYVLDERDYVVHPTQNDSIWYNGGTPYGVSVDYFPWGLAIEIR